MKKPIIEEDNSDKDNLTDDDFGEDDFDQDDFEHDLKGDLDKDAADSATAKRAADEDENEDDDDEEDDVDLSDVEADLEEILRERMAARDDDDEDEPKVALRARQVVAPPRSGEWTCEQCFLIVSLSQFGSRQNPTCPSDEDPCESIDRILRR